MSCSFPPICQGGRTTLYLDSRCWQRIPAAQAIYWGSWNPEPEKNGAYPLVMTKSSPWKPWPIEIDDFPSYKPPFMVGIFHGYVSHNQMVIIYCSGSDVSLAVFFFVKCWGLGSPNPTVFSEHISMVLGSLLLLIQSSIYKIWMIKCSIDVN